MRRSGRLADQAIKVWLCPLRQLQIRVIYKPTSVVVLAPHPDSGSAEPSTSTSTVEVTRAKLESLEKDSISFRLLEALLKHAPTVEGANVIITDIIAASAEPNGLDQLAEFYKTNIKQVYSYPVNFWLLSVVALTGLNDYP